jgi:signal peptidase II
VILLDFVTKQIALSHLVLHKPVALLPFFNLTLVKNTGVAFGFLSTADPGWERWLLSAISIAATTVFYRWLCRCKDPLEASAIALLLGGALGNFIDRAFYGSVVDFVDLYVGAYHWPAFNIADTAICLGLGLLLISWMKHEQHT